MQLIDKIAAQIPSLCHIIMLTDAAHLPSTVLLPNVATC